MVTDIPPSRRSPLEHERDDEPSLVEAAETLALRSAALALERAALVMIELGHVSESGETLAVEIRALGPAAIVAEARASMEGRG
jgi:hypothetical protein